jgi:hypothetical protein
LRKSFRPSQGARPVEFNVRMVCLVGYRPLFFDDLDRLGVRQFPTGLNTAFDHPTQHFANAIDEIRVEGP